MKGYIVEVEKQGVTVSHYFDCITDALTWMEKGYTASLDDEQERVKYSIYEHRKEKP